MKAVIFRVLVALVLLCASEVAAAQDIIYSTPGSHTFTVPSNVTRIRFQVWGSGGTGDQGSAGGGGFCQSTKAVTPGETIYVSVGNGNAGRSASTGPSWFNVSANTSPSNSSQGCVGGGGTTVGGSHGAGGIGSFGDINFTGGNGAYPNTSNGNGGGSSAGPLSNGNNGAGSTGGAAVVGGGAGGNATTSTATDGGSPGGGGGACYQNDTTCVLSHSGGGIGGNGLVTLTYVFVPPSSGASQMFLVWPG